MDAEDVLAAEMAARAESKNLSFFAFTATPKAKTLELFGRKGPDGLPQPFHLYSMQQAIEEGFILDVLKNYTPYKTAFRLTHNGQSYEIGGHRQRWDRRGHRQRRRRSWWTRVRRSSR